MEVPVLFLRQMRHSPFLWLFGFEKIPTHASPILFSISIGAVDKVVFRLLDAFGLRSLA